MAHTVTLQPSGHSYTAADDASLLQAALDAGLTLPYGCRNGACGACKGKVVDGSVDPGEAQENVLTTDDRAEGFVLTCCAKPLSDLVLEVHEVVGLGDIPVKIMPCRVQELRKVADDVMVMTLKLPSSERLQFLAGQYIEFMLADGKRRAFSLANAPHEDDLLELHIRHIPGGNFTAQVFSTLKVKDILRFEGPLGSFRLREESDKPMVMVAGGTGFAPIKALIEHAIHNNITRPIALYWGAKNRAELYMPDLPEQWAAEHPHITYVPVLSEPLPGDAWTGRIGFVHLAVLEDFADLSGHQAYVCGAPVMVEAAQRDFIARGLPADEFFADIFSYAAKAEKK
ncbi:MAG: CDP-6-deoxy-delta-3,4-glucoseen reductase [Gammaproteobacteria bacterium]|nr:CDP-6-deoxy-delta-3,4-glucoseen reductase [Gammaproteobacteria bacterium]MBU1414570.1 CDP-6-deoxy-delta-3,4-glucoseen reductase [Gammaproteobacteria bacterium]